MNSRFRSLAPWALVAAMLALSLAGGSSMQYFAATTMIWAIFAIGFDLAFGVAGLLSFGHAAFYGIGAYAVAILSKQLGVPPLWGLIAGVVVSGLLAAIVGSIALRLSGVFLGLTTLAIAQLIEVIVTVRLRDISGGPEGLAGIARPSVFGFEIRSNESYTLFVAGVFIAVLFLSALLRVSPWGRALDAMRQNEVRADQLGFNVKRLKLSVFAVSGALSGLAGGLLAMLMKFVSPEPLRWTVSGDILITTLIGGAGTLFGPVAGSIVVTLLRELLSQVTDRWHGLLGLVLIAITLFLPGGLAQLGRRFGLLKPNES